MANPEVYESQKHLLEQVPSGYLYYPLVFVNDEFSFSGGVDYYQILYVLRDVLQPEQAATS